MDFGFLPQFHQKKKKICGHVLVSQIKIMQVKQYLCEIWYYFPPSTPCPVDVSVIPADVYETNVIWTGVNIQAKNTMSVYHLGHRPYGCTYNLT